MWDSVCLQYNMTENQIYENQNQKLFLEVYFDIV